MAVAALAQGTSVITERIYPERFMHAAEMKRMGADISVSQGQAVVHGVDRLQGTEVMASDLSGEQDWLLLLQQLKVRPSFVVFIILIVVMKRLMSDYVKLA